MLFCAIGANAQHCPYDGTQMIAIKVIDKQGKMLTDINTVFYLQEIDNPMADSWPYAKGLVKRQFLDTKGFIADCNEKFNRNGYNSELNNRLRNCGVFATPI